MFSSAGGCVILDVFLLSNQLLYKVYKSNSMVETSWMDNFMFGNNMPMGLLNRIVLSCICHRFMVLDSLF